MSALARQRTELQREHATGASACGDMTANYDQWLNIARGGFAPSLVIINGRMMSGVEASASTP